MSGTAIASVFALGPRITAQVLGLPFQQYRCADTGPVVTLSNNLGTTPVWITADPGLMSSIAFQYGKPSGYAAVDPSLTLVGDYLVGALTVGGPTETFFIASQDIPAPIQVVRCNHTINIARAADTLAPGSTGTYSGSAINDAAPFMTGWPATILQLSSGSKMGGTGMQLPSDGKLPGVAVWLPATAPDIHFNDVISDENDVRYFVSSVELTPLGYRITAEVEPTA